VDETSLLVAQSSYSLPSDSMQLSITTIAVLPGAAPHNTVPKACIVTIHLVPVHDLLICMFNDA
jgi:hypothetical protein